MLLKESSGEEPVLDIALTVLLIFPLVLSVASEVGAGLHTQALPFASRLRASSDRLHSLGQRVMAKVDTVLRTKGLDVQVEEGAGAETTSETPMPSQEQAEPAAGPVADGAEVSTPAAVEESAVEVQEADRERPLPPAAILPPASAIASTESTENISDRLFAMFTPQPSPTGAHAKSQADDSDLRA